MNESQWRKMGVSARKKGKLCGKLSEWRKLKYIELKCPNSIQAFTSHTFWRVSNRFIIFVGVFRFNHLDFQLMSFILLLSLARSFVRSFGFNETFVCVKAFSSHPLWAQPPQMGKMFNKNAQWIYCDWIIGAFSQCGSGVKLLFIC